MPKYRLDISYDGSGFRGYAKQVGQRTIQGELESVLETVLGAVSRTSVAGRTDAGVHARGQVVSFSFDEGIDPARLQRSLNGMLGPEVSVAGIGEVEDGFDARFSATWRRYRYVIDPRPSPDPLIRHMVWHLGRTVSFEAMREVGDGFIGLHDFSSFCRSVEGKSNVRNVEEAKWVEREGLYEFWVKANAFCHQMVRSMVGYAYDVGRGYAEAGKVSEVIKAGDRSLVGTVAPAHGLTLWDVGY
jgi:tRNA pseudouridine38-40 synthase